MSMVVVGCIGAAGSIASGIIGMGSARSAARAAAREKARLTAELNSLENSRQAVINPYAGFKDVSNLATNLSGMISNPYASLGVATQASKFEAEQIDISLANTLDTLKETGASAGGATALANAALRSKQGISANLEQQEAQNEKLRAQGQQQMEQLKMAESQRIQGVQISEAQRMQQGEAAGKEFMFNATESRQQGKINRVAGQLGIAGAQEQQARSDYTGALTGMIGGVTSAVGSMASAGAFSGGGSFQAPTGGVNTSSGVGYKFGSAGGGFNSDRRLKKNINKIGVSSKGLNIYSFEYIDDKFGSGIWQGVMSDEVPLKAVIKDENGYDKVNYSLLDVEFKQI